MKHHCEFEKASSVFILVQILKEFKRKRKLNMRMELIVHYCKKHKDKTLSSRAIELIYTYQYSYAIWYYSSDMALKNKLYIE